MSTETAARRTKLRLTTSCTSRCTVNHARLPIADTVNGWFEEGRPYRWIVTEAKKAGFDLTLTSLSRHRSGHLVLDVSDGPENAPNGTDKVDHLAVLEKMIAAGAKNAATWRIGPAETLKAMDMYYKLTQGSAFDALFAALSGAAAGDEGAELPEVDGATFSPAEFEAQDAAEAP